MTDFLDRIGDGVRLVDGIGPFVTDSTALPWSQAAADRALRALRAGRHARRVALISDVSIEALLLELGNLIAERGDSPSGPIEPFPVAGGAQVRRDTPMAGRWPG